MHTKILMLVLELTVVWKEKEKPILQTETEIVGKKNKVDQCCDKLPVKSFYW